MYKNGPHRDFGEDGDWGECRQCYSYFNYKNEPKEKQIFLACSKGELDTTSRNGCRFMVCRKCCETMVKDVILPD